MNENFSFGLNRDIAITVTVYDARQPYTTIGLTEAKRLSFVVCKNYLIFVLEKRLISNLAFLENLQKRLYKNNIGRRKI